MRNAAFSLWAASIVAGLPLYGVGSPPVGTSIDVHNGSYTTPEPEILVSLTATDDVGVTGYYVSQNGVSPGAGDFIAVSPTASFDEKVPYTIGGGFGEITLRAWFRDGDGFVSQPLTYDLLYADKEAVVVSTVIEGTGSSDGGLAVASDAAGSVYLAGYERGNVFTNAGSQAYVAKYTGTTQQWERWVTSAFGFGTGFAQAIDIVVDALGNSYSAGYDLADVLPDDTSIWQAFVVEFDSDGVEGLREYLSNDGTRTEGYGVALGPSGSIYIVGMTNGTFPGETNAGGSDAFIAKYSPAGTLQWTRQFGTAGSDAARDIAIDGAGSLYVVGYASGSLFGALPLGSPGQSDLFLSKFAGDGSHLWTRLMGSALAPETAHRVALANGFVYVAGGTTNAWGPNGASDVFVAKYSAVGSECWSRIFDGQGEGPIVSSEEAYGVSVDERGVVYLVGRTYDSLDGNLPPTAYDLFVMKYDPTGKRLLTFTYGPEEGSRGVGSALAPDGSLLVAGATRGELYSQMHQGSDDVLLLRLELSQTAPAAAVSADGFESGDVSCWSAAAP